MKKFTITLSTVKNLQGWSENNNLEQFNLIECEFYSSNLESAKKLMKALEENYRLPNGIAAQTFVLTEEK